MPVRSWRCFAFVLVAIALSIVGGVVVAVDSFNHWTSWAHVIESPSFCPWLKGDTSFKYKDPSSSACVAERIFASSGKTYMYSMSFLGIQTGSSFSENATFQVD